MNDVRLALALLLACVMLASAAQAGGWRSDGTGRYPDATPPVTWDAEEGPYLWKASLPDWSNASVSLAPDRLFVCVEPDRLVCLARDDGRRLWESDCSGLDLLTEAERTRWNESAPQRKELENVEKQLRGLRRKKDADAEAKRTQLEARRDALREELADVPDVALHGGHSDTGGSTPTPWVDADARRVYTYFASGVVAAHDFEGERLWMRTVKTGPSSWGHSASPVLSGGLLIVHHGDVSALNLATGDTVWMRNSKTSYGSPVGTRIGDEDVVVTASGLLLRSRDGAILSDKLPRLPYNAPVVSDGVVYYAGVGDKHAAAWRLPATAEPESAVEELWKTPIKKGRYYGSPVLHGDHLFAVRQSGTVTVLHRTSGEALKEEGFEALHQHRGQCYPSLTIAGDRLIVTSDNGTMLVLEPTPELTQVAANTVEKGRSCPIFDGNRLYMRTRGHVVCIATP